LAGYAFCFNLGIQGSSSGKSIGPIYFLTPTDYGFIGGPNFTINTINGDISNHTDPYPWNGFAKLTLLFWTYSVGTEQLTVVVRNGPTVMFNVHVTSQSGQST
jgi:hypothetical protein